MDSGGKVIEEIEGGAGPLRGEIILPSDKSISHRAAILGGIATGETLVEDFLLSDDTISTLNAMRMMGVSALMDNKGLLIKGVGLRGLTEPPDVIDAGNSGTTARLLTGLLSAQSFFSALTGDAYLRKRPMHRVVEPLRAMGADIRGRENGARLPLAVIGSELHGIEYSPPQASAQVKTALLIAGLYAEGETVIIETLPTRDHTERMLRYLGVEVLKQGGGIGLRGGASLKGGVISVPADISSAAYFIVAALINPGSEILIKKVGLNPLRTGVIDILREMGGDIDIVEKGESSGEPVGDIVVRSSSLTGVEIGGAIIPRSIDELPVVAVAACYAEGTTVIRDAAELRVKETDRVRAMGAELEKMGASIEEREDGMVIGGKERLTGARCSSWGDHRVAMALAVAGTGASGVTEVEGAGSVSVSFPDFFAVLRNLR
ncbi:MAG: 3-phosphoshikimate 1-carboxyvinyltransferase [Thermodesulfobacteriota bacterium]